MTENNLQPDKKRYWFPAKKYGWGWGFPNCWQGWLVYAIWAACLFAGTPLLLKNHLTAYIACTIILSIVLLIIVMIKGEPPRWRWGGD
jgi:hypothetical protein